MNEYVPPIPIILPCPKCGHRHIDEGEFATRVHHTHSCQVCGTSWRPALVPTIGVAFLPGFKDPKTIAGPKECPRGHRDTAPLLHEVTPPIEDALVCLSCRASYVCIRGRWFEAPEQAR